MPSLYTLFKQLYDLSSFLSQETPLCPFISQPVSLPAKIKLDSPFLKDRDAQSLKGER